uniref:Uncharacterized protein n=1 Tax=Oryza glumipatula TaxID=40148 RepID=A0A0E0AHC0_9ORYZ
MVLLKEPPPLGLHSSVHSPRGSQLGDVLLAGHGDPAIPHHKPLGGWLPPVHALWQALVRIMELSGAFEGRLLEDFPGCPREMQRGLAAMLITPGECNLETIHDRPSDASHLAPTQAPHLSPMQVFASSRQAAARQKSLTARPAALPAARHGEILIGVTNRD